MHALLGEMLAAMGRVDVPAARALLLQGVREYVPAPDLFDAVWCRVERDREVVSRREPQDRRLSAA